MSYKDRIDEVPTAYKNEVAIVHAVATKMELENNAHDKYKMTFNGLSFRKFPRFRVTFART
jgi:hypothetical protein